MSIQTSCESLHNVTFSPGSASGLTRSAVQGGQMIARSGQAHAHASRSAHQGEALDLTTSATCGRRLQVSSASAALSASLANRLQAITLIRGSTLYNLTWKEWATPSGLCRSRLRASVRRTSETERIGWPTPIANDAQGSDYSTSRGEKILKLGGVAKLAGWVTPTARDWKDTAGMTAQREGRERLDQLPRQAYTCQPLRLTVFGVMQTGSIAAMENGGQLNPAHSRWLMGLPRAWDECSPMWQEWQAATGEAA